MNYIYQTIHTIAHHPLYVAEHCRLLEQAFMELYFRPLRLDAESVEEAVVELLTSERASRELSVFVELRVDIDFRWSVVVSDVSIYSGYSLRCVRPTAECITFDSPFGRYPTSARREVLRFAGDLALNFGAELAIECDTKGCVISAAGAALFGVVDRCLVTTPLLQSVERELVITAAKAHGLEIIEEQYTKKELPKFEELFAVDHQGVVSISSCGDRHFMGIVAERIATKLAAPF